MIMGRILFLVSIIFDVRIMQLSSAMGRLCNKLIRLCGVFNDDQFRCSLEISFKTLSIGTVVFRSERFSYRWFAIQ